MASITIIHSLFITLLFCLDPYLGLYTCILLFISVYISITIITIMTLTTTITQPFTITSQPPVEARHTFGNQQKTTAVWLQSAWPLLEFRHWGVLGGAPVYTDTLQHLPASSRGQAHFLKSTKVVPGLYWKPGTGRCCCVHRHTAAPPSLLQSPVEASYTQLGSLQLLI